MHADNKVLFDLEKKFWQSIVDEDTDTATSLLTEPAFMVSGHGAFKFDHARCRQMAEQGSMVVKSFELSDMDAIYPTPEACSPTASEPSGHKTHQRCFIFNKVRSVTSVVSSSDPVRCAMPSALDNAGRRGRIVMR